MTSNTLFQTTVILLLIGHVGATLGLWYGPRSATVLVSVNGLVSLGVLVYVIRRTPYILAAKDWSQIALAAFELVVLACAIWALRHNRAAIIASYISFGIHFLVAIAAVVFAFTFKVNRLI